MLIEQTHRRAEETLEFKITQPRETFHFKPPISNHVSWMTRLTSLELYTSIFNINTTNNKFELCTDNFDGFSFEELKNDHEEILNFIKIHHIIYNKKK